jgi:hypothetical protein
VNAPPPPPATDTVRITRAEYDSGKRVLRVEATRTSASATLQVFNSGSGSLIGTLGNSGGGQYRGEFNVTTNPQNITVRSNHWRCCDAGCGCKVSLFQVRGGFRDRPFSCYQLIRNSRMTLIPKPVSNVVVPLRSPSL